MRIGVVTATPGLAHVIWDLLSRESTHDVAWLADHADEALRRCAHNPPELVLMDLFVPGMGGVEATRRIVTSTSCAVLIMASDVGAYAAEIFEAMGQGALDAVDTPHPEGINAASRAARFLSKLQAVDRRIGGRNGAPPQPVGEGRAPRLPARALVAIGASAGGPAALRTVLGGLPRDFSAAVVVVQHMDQRFAPGMVDWLSDHSRLPIRLGQEGDVPSAGVVLLANTNDHLILKSASQLGYTAQPDDYVYRPSVDVFFHSVCRIWNGRAIGVLLTGMGRDGALGLKAMRDKGHHTIAQDRESCAVYGMPKAAAESGAAVEVVGAAEMAAHLLKALSRTT
jgi:two-component system, chemotaxis family, response regulator WspF